jgi:hypothetical protein
VEGDPARGRADRDDDPARGGAEPRSRQRKASGRREPRSRRRQAWRGRGTSAVSLAEARRFFYPREGARVPREGRGAGATRGE